MGKKSLKGKEKKLKRKEEILKLNEAALAVKKADSVEDPLEALKAFQKYERNGINVTIQCKLIKNMTEAEFDAAFKLIEENMKGLYEQSSWGWNEKGKKEEMREENARYLMAFNAENKLVAMSHFRFDVDDDLEVLYCYEIQLTQEVRRKGLGKFLVQILELMAMKAKMKKVVLTVFTANLKAVDFFTKMKYTIDDTSPQFEEASLEYEDSFDVETYDYEIYSKWLAVK